MAAYTPAFWWGTPYATAADRTNAWATDDEMPMGPLAQLHDIVHPKPTQNPNLGYPMLQPFMVLATYAPYIGWLKLTGGLGTPTEAFPHGFSDPVRALRVLSLLAHFLSVLLGAGIVLAAYETANVLWGSSRHATWAALFAGLAFPMFYYARTANVDVPVLFFSAVALWSFATCIVKGVTIRRGISLGLWVGLALATKEPSFASFLGIPFVLLLLPQPGASQAGWKDPLLWRAAGLTLLASVLAYALASGMVVDPRRWIAHIDFIRQRSGDAVKGAVAFMVYYPRTWEGHINLTRTIVDYLADTLTPPGLLVATIGVVWSAMTKRRAFAWSVSGLTYLAVLFWSARAAQLRYVMPAAYVLAIFAAYAAAEASTSRRKLVRLSVVPTALAGVTLALLRGVDLTHAMLTDTRHDAARWLKEHARPGDRLDYFGSDQKNAPMEAWLESGRAVRYLGGNIVAPRDSATVATILKGWEERKPRFVSLIPDYTSAPGTIYAASCPPDIFRRLEDGSAGYRRVASFQERHLIPWVRRPALDYPVVSPPIVFYERTALSGSP